jgi:putative acetyltransferase
LIIRNDNLEHPGVLALLDAHLEHMYETSPPESVHALDIEALREPGVTFWSAWEGEDVLGCAALKELETTHGEIKSMRTDSAHLGQGVASRLLQHVIDVARERGYRRLSLETGSGEAFEPAHQLYLKFGFVECEPFADYTDDPFSRFMTLAISA